jgi:hypothetical protein
VAAQGKVDEGHLYSRTPCSQGITQCKSMGEIKPLNLSQVWWEKKKSECPSIINVGISILKKCPALW